MGAGVDNAGFDEARGCTVLNATSPAVTLYRGETVVWDITTPASTDQALRVKKATADADPLVAGVLLRDIAPGTYGPMAHTGRVRARVDSGVTAGSALILDYVAASGAVPALGKMKLRAVPGEYAGFAVAFDAAAQEPSGSGQYWADVVLAGLNMAAINALLYGGASLSMQLDSVGVATSSLPYRAGHMRCPKAGSIVRFGVVLMDTTIAASDANIWAFTLETLAGTDIAIMTNSVALGGAAFTAGIVRWQAATTNVVTADQMLMVTASSPLGTPVDGQNGDDWLFFAEMDTGLTVPLMFGR